MPARKAEPLCQIVFRDLTIPVYDLEDGRKKLEGVFMIGGSGEITKGTGRRGRIARKAGAGGTRAAKRDERQKKIAELLGKEPDLKAGAIAKRVGASLMTVTRDMKDLKATTAPEKPKKVTKKAGKAAKAPKEEKKSESENEASA